MGLFDLLVKIISKKSKNPRWKKAWRALSFTVACIVVFVTTYGMILPAITVDSETALYLAGFDSSTMLIEDENLRYARRGSSRLELIDSGDDAEVLISGVEDTVKNDSTAAGASAEELEGPFDFEPQEEIQKDLFTYNGRELSGGIPYVMSVRLVYEQTAYIPDGTILLVNEITQERESYAAYAESAKNTIDQSGQSWSRESLRLFEMNLIAPDGSMVVPMDTVRVYYSAASALAGDKAAAVSFVSGAIPAAELILPVEISADGNGTLYGLTFDLISTDVFGIITGTKTGGQDGPAETTTEEVPVAATTEETTVETTTEEPAVETTTEELLFETTTEEAPVEITTEEVPAETTTEEPLFETTTEEVSVETTTEEPFFETTTEEVSVETTTEEPLFETTTEEAPVETTTEEALSETTTENSEPDKVHRTLAVEGANYVLHISYSENAGIPEDAVFEAKAIADPDEAEQYGTEARNTILASLSGDSLMYDCSSALLALFDLTIYDDEGYTISPKEPLGITVEFDEMPDGKGDIHVVHFPETGVQNERPEAEGSSVMPDEERVPSQADGSTVPDGEQLPAAADGSAMPDEEQFAAPAGQSSAYAAEDDVLFSGSSPELSGKTVRGTVVSSWEGEESVSFSADDFSYYAVVRITLEKTITAGDGRTYHISVTFAPDAGIPIDAELQVSEILLDTEETDGVSLYEEFVERAENTLGWNSGDSGYARNFDISIADNAGETLEPLTPVDVNVYLEDAQEDGEELRVVHFGPVNEVMDSVTEGRNVYFSATGFSTYTVLSSGTTTNLNGRSFAIGNANTGNFMMAVKQNNNRLQAMHYTITGSRIEVDTDITLWKFEKVSGTNLYYISDGKGNYLNIGNSNSSYVTISGTPQAIYVREKNDGTVRLQYGSANNSTAVNNYSGTTAQGFGPYNDNGNNEWFTLYEVEKYIYSTVTFNRNGGNGTAPGSITGVPGDVITLPDYTGTRSGYTFLGWSTGSNLVNKTYYPVYPAGSSFTIPENDTTLYAVWTSNSPDTAEFYIRLDGTIPYEPDHYESSAYTGMIRITGAITKQIWVTDNDVKKPSNGVNVENNVTAGLAHVPSVDQIVANINASYSKLGFKVANVNGEVVVTQITNQSTNSKNYNVSEGDALYVLWYVQKRESTWHVDGTLLVKDKVNISYDGNVTDGSVSNVPLGYQESRGTEVTIGANASKNGPVKTPARPGYIFLGWNLKQDGSGEWFYNNDKYVLNEDTTLYAQWSKGKNYMTVSKTNEDGEVLAGAAFKLEEKTARGNFIEKANRTTNESGVFTYDQMENDTIYRMTESYAPNGYEVQNSFYFKVATDGSGSTVLKIRVCDEEGNFIDTPDWLELTYVPADDPSANGVAKILFKIRDERIKRSIRFVKVDENGDPLAQAEYALTNAKGKSFDDILLSASGTDGVFSVPDAVLPYGTYTLTETKAPPTFRTGSDVTFTLNDYIDASNTGLTITGGDAEAGCVVSEETDQGLTTITYAYTITVTDVQQTHIIVTKDVEVDGDLALSDIDTTVYFALTKKGEHGYVMKDGEVWIETMQIRGGVPSPERVIFEGMDNGEYDVWEMEYIDGQYTRMYNGLAVDENIQLDKVSASSADGGNNAVIRSDKISAQVDFKNTYGRRVESTSFVANKRWADRAGNEIDPPENTVIEFTIYAETQGGEAQKVRSVELDGETDGDGELSPWQATFRYLPIKDEDDNLINYKVKETVLADDFYPNNYPEEYYLENSGGTITNRKLLTDIEIHKSFEMRPLPPDYQIVRDKADQLVFTLECSNGQTWSYKLSDFDNIESVTDDFVLTLHDMPLGTYTLTESGQEDLLDGYELVYSVPTAAAAAAVGDTTTPVLKDLSLQNIYAKKGSLTVSKHSVTVESVGEYEIPAEISDKEYSFVVKQGDLFLQENGTLGTEAYTFSLKEGESRRFLDVPVGRYTVTEQNASVPHYEWEVTNGTEKDDAYFIAANVLVNEEGTALFDNKYTMIERGTLTVEKNVSGGPEEAASKDYEVEIRTTRKGTPYWLDASGNLVTEQTVLSVSQENPLTIGNVPAGEYTIKENEESAAFDDYSLEVSYAPQTVSVRDETQSTAVITNAYTYLFTPVVIKKNVTGNLGNKDQYFGFDLRVTDAEDRPLEVPGITDRNGFLSFNIKDGDEKRIEKLPKGAKLTILEHNDKYTTTVEGFVGTDPDEGAQQITDGSFLTTDTAAQYSFKIPDDGAAIVFTNAYNLEYSVVLKKVGFENTTEETWDLEGAVFRIYSDPDKSEEHLVTLDEKDEFVSDEEGIFYEGVLEPGTYYLDETKAPAGYVRPEGMYVLMVEEDGVTLSRTETIGTPDLNTWISEETDSETGEAVYTIRIRNVTGVSLPSTGGTGTRVFTVLGSMMVAFAGVLLLRKRFA